MIKKPIFVTGIGTYVGKTVASAVLCEQLQADYWKPVQAGDLSHSDSKKIMNLVSNSKTVVHPESFLLDMAASPHHAAMAEGIEIHSKDFRLPETDNLLVIEGAGGLLVPFTNDYLMIDLIRQCQAEVVVVIRNYLGCINHSLLTMQVIRVSEIPFKHVIFNGNFPEATLDILINHIPKGVNWSILPEFEELNKINISLAPTQLLPLR